MVSITIIRTYRIMSSGVFIRGQLIQEPPYPSAYDPVKPPHSLRDSECSDAIFRRMVLWLQDSDCANRFAFALPPEMHFLSGGLLYTTRCLGETLAT